jgi:hypothetical protein
MSAAGMMEPIAKASPNFKGEITAIVYPLTTEATL